jgi:hypothetical protein
MEELRRVVYSKVDEIMKELRRVVYSKVIDKLVGTETLTI